MSIALKELKALFLKSGNRCAFSDCGETLLLEDDSLEAPVNLNNIAHIVAESPDGPRGRSHLSQEERNRESNLILMCERHHHIIDQRPQFYTVERLRQMKEDHEALMFAATGKAISSNAHSTPDRSSYVRETLYSTLFQVIELPARVYGAVCEYADNKELLQKLVHPRDSTEIYPYIIQGGALYAFQDLSSSQGPFQDVVDRRTTQSDRSQRWWDDPIKSLWFKTLLNRSLNKLTGRKGLNLDREHQRYYFQPDKLGEIKEVTYRPLNQSTSSRQVVWQPIRKSTNEPRPYWLHRAVNLQFHRVTPTQWCLSVRPEFRVTKDGATPEVSEQVGSRVTKEKSHRFNYDLLGEVNFWRDFLSDSQPRIIMNYGQGQRVIISTAMMQTDIEWPGMPEKFAKPFKNVDYAEDLFSWARLNGLEANLEYGSDNEDEGNEPEDEDNIE